LAEGAKVALVMPSVLDLVASTPAFSAQNGDTLFFEVGDLKPFEITAVQLNVKTKCDTFLIGQTLCFETFAAPDNACPVNLPAYSEIKLSAQCLADTVVRFTIKNIGDAPTQAPHAYKIIRNEISGTAVGFSLNAQQSMVVDVPADGATYRMEATKRDDGSLTATALENCAGLTPGQITAFWFDKGGVDYDFDCRQVIGSYDPNLKTAVPAGVGSQHTLGPNRTLEYTIDFQNTGSDAAYQVILRDVLDKNLDISTFRPGFASHPYTWDIRGMNTLNVLFSMIMLPDSAVDEPGSHGFFNFSIEQKPNLPDGTKLENTANIFFDSNPFIATNTVRHHIGQLTVRVDEIQHFPDLWQVLGNPTRTTATFLAATFISGKKWFDLFDVSGRLVRTAQFSGQELLFQREGLPGGLYLFRIGDAYGRIFTGKIVVSD
jgi:uncharacterized repeat protein (TIGR01451 family)